MRRQPEWAHHQFDFANSGKVIPVSLPRAGKPDFQYSQLLICNNEGPYSPGKGCRHLNWGRILSQTGDFVNKWNHSHWWKFFWTLWQPQWISL